MSSDQSFPEWKSAFNNWSEYTDIAPSPWQTTYLVLFGSFITGFLPYGELSNPQKILAWSEPPPPFLAIPYFPSIVQSPLLPHSTTWAPMATSRSEEEAGSLDNLEEGLKRWTTWGERWRPLRRQLNPWLWVYFKHLKAPNWSGQGAEKLRDRIFRSCVYQLDLFLSLFPCWQHCSLVELTGTYTYTNYNILATQLPFLCEWV